ESAQRVMLAREWGNKKLPRGTTLSDCWLDYTNACLEGDSDAARLKHHNFDPGLAEDMMNNPSERGELMAMGYTMMGPEDMPTHSQFVEMLNLESRQRRAHEDLGLLRTLLEPWGKNGRYGAILDGVNTVDLTKKVVHFELSFIPESAKELRDVAAFMITNDVRKEIMRRPRNIRKRVILEELSA